MLDIVKEGSNPLRLNISQEKFKASGVITLLVEGRDDFYWMKSIITESNSKSRILIRVEGGKSNVISKVKNKEFNYGLVDMDYDFEGEEINGIKTIVDTRTFCCTFGLIFQTLDSIRLQHIIFNSMKWNYAAKSRYKQLEIDSVKKYGIPLIDFLSDVVKRASMLQLFQGWAYENTKLEFGSNPLAHEWIFLKIMDDHNLNFEEFIEDLIYEEKIEFQRFQQKFQAELDVCGANDHLFQHCIKMWIKKNFKNEFDVTDDDFDKGFSNILRLEKIEKSLLTDEMLNKFKKWKII